MKTVLIFVATLASVLSLGSSQYLGFGGVVGSLTPRTGSKWPPFPGAGQGFWAKKAGFYNNRVRRSAEPLYLGLGGVVGQLTPRTSGRSVSSLSRSLSSSRRQVSWMSRVAHWNNRRGRRSAEPLYLGLGGVVGQLTPRTSGRSVSSLSRSLSSSRQQGSWMGRGARWHNRRGRRSAEPLYLGLGGVVGQLTPRTSGRSVSSWSRSLSSSRFSIPNRRSSFSRRG